MFKNHVPLWLIYYTAIIFAVIMILEIIMFVYEINENISHENWFYIGFDIGTIGIVAFILFSTVKAIKQRK